jgi:hypothetical protein
MLDLARGGTNDWNRVTVELVTYVPPDVMLDLYHSALWFITDPSYAAATHSG